MPLRLEGLDKAKLVPQEITGKLERFKRALVPPLVEDFIASEPRGGNWPKPRRKTIQQQTKGIVKGDTIIIGTFSSRYARALDTGFTVSSGTKKKVMRFRGKDGTYQFVTGSIHHPARPYFARVLSQVPRIVLGVYEEVFSDDSGVVR